MGRILFFLLLALAAYIGWRWWRSRSSSPAARAGSPGGEAENMVRCASCGLNLPQSEALPGADAAAGRWYCCESHRREARPQ